MTSSRSTEVKNLMFGVTVLIRLYLQKTMCLDPQRGNINGLSS